MIKRCWNAQDPALQLWLVYFKIPCAERRKVVSQLGDSHHPMRLLVQSIFLFRDLCDLCCWGSELVSQLPFWGWPPCWELGCLSVILTSAYSVIWIKSFPYLYHCCLCLVFFSRKFEVWLQNLPFVSRGSALQRSFLPGMRSILTLPSPAAGPPEATVLLLLWVIFLHLQPDMSNPQEGLLL